MRTKAEVFEDVVQHLTHGGFSELEICQLTGGMTPAQVRQAAINAQRRRPKLCKMSCAGCLGQGQAVALCPYCAKTLAIVADMQARQAKA